ncbi:hypothetical protein HBI49_222050 [Parastagonospora nodorum]|nr:hypothetical protein HBI49_222050 [Parastagonospora nodorum]KAH5485052.1 hypothetical protein HBI29_233090 [Parastagonospora nodorum]KAH5665101.1 hypothetical protein HBI44_227810 [Parastagonospora nodorum]KAH6190958.1 hypothetical protein HBI53_232100 [Parastagonospora nodorum]KAH6381732.1 hypothetical protein HBI14_232360 [Parastagonospora nodorum]
MPATIDEPEDDFVCVASPVLPTAKSITVHEDFVEVTAGIDEPVELYQTTVERTPTKIVVTLHGEQPQTKVLNAKQAIALLVTMFFDRIPVGSPLKRYQFQEGLSVLDDSAKFLSNTPSCYFDLIHVLHNIAADSRWVLSLVLRDFLEDKNWPSAVFVGHEIHPVVWAVLLGPLGLAAGSIEGKLRADILLEAEDHWVQKHVHDEDFDAQLTELARFAAALCEMGKEALTPPEHVLPEAVPATTVASDPVARRRARKIAVSKVRIVGPA